MRLDRSVSAGVMLCGLLLLGAGGALARAVGGAVRATAGGSREAATPPEAPVPLPAVEQQPEDAGEPSVPTELVSRAAERAPFDPRRRAPEGRYRLPEERVPEAPPPPPPPELPPPAFRVLATVGGAGGGVAVIEEEGQPPRVVAVGEDVQGYRVASVGDRSLVVSREGLNVSLRMEDVLTASAPAPTGGRNQGGRGSGGRGQAGRTTEGAGNAAEVARQRVQEALERLQQQGRGGAAGNQGGRGRAGQQGARPPGGG